MLYADRIEHNLKWMQAFVAEYGVKLAPHGKTTMAPQLFRRQIETGAWGITLATAHQVRAAYRGGISRVLMANQLVGKHNMLMIAELLSDPDFEFFCLVDSVEGVCLVDSVEGVEQLGVFFGSVRKKLQVLLELGVPGGRTGVRDEAQRNAVLDAIARYPDSLQLAGVELYEGVLKDEHEVRAFLRSAVATTHALADAGRFARTPAILSGAGSAWYDVVAEEFAKASDASRIEIVLRPGCYLTHDVGVYRKAQTDIFARNPGREENGRRLVTRAAIVGVCAVDSGTGPRDHRVRQTRCGVRCGAAEPARHYRPGSAAPREVAASEGWEVFALMDQHAYMRIPAGVDLKSRRHDRIRHLASVPDIRQMASVAGGRSVVSRDRSDRDVLLNRVQQASGGAAR